jgi:septal ring factor EnvC (AmiA/AmiB activator)
LEAELSTSQTAEQTRAADFEQLIDDLETDQDNTEDRIARDVTLINSLQGNIAANTDILESLNESIPSVQ